MRGIGIHCNSFPRFVVDEMEGFSEKEVWRCWCRLERGNIRAANKLQEKGERERFTGRHRAHTNETENKNTEVFGTDSKRQVRGEAHRVLLDRKRLAAETQRFSQGNISM